MSIEEINQLCKNTLIEYLDIEFTRYGEGFIEAKMPVNKKKLQPMGVLHGGASLALVETLASAGSFIMVDETKFDVFGLQVTGNHVATISSGELFARADIVHQGKLTHVWDVRISSDEGKLISIGRVTNIIMEKK